jgi:hypothetical protein
VPAQANAPQEQAVIQANARKASPALLKINAPLVQYAQTTPTTPWLSAVHLANATMKQQLHVFQQALQLWQDKYTVNQESGILSVQTVSF